MSRRAALIVLDGLGIGPAHDQAAYGDDGSDTLGNALAQAPRWYPDGMRLPQLERLGLGRCAALAGLSGTGPVSAAYGTAQPASPGKDSTTGHWELAGVVLERPFPTFPAGFPAELLTALSYRTGRGVLANRPASGTAVIEAFGPEHLRTGHWIVYTSADSVLQIAAHEAVVSVDELYRACEVARAICTGPWGVSRVIARPFEGGPGGWVRTPVGGTSRCRPPERPCSTGWSRPARPGSGLGRWTTFLRGEASRVRIPRPMPPRIR